MEFTQQGLMQLPASYAVLSEDEMIYIEGGALEFNISQQDIANFAANVGINLILMFGRTAFANTVAGIQDMRNDGLTTMGAIEHYWGRQTPAGKTMTFVFAGFAGFYLYVQAMGIINSFLSVYSEMKNAYDSADAQNAAAAGTLAA